MLKPGSIVINRARICQFARAKVSSGQFGILLQRFIALGTEKLVDLFNDGSLKYAEGVVHGCGRPGCGGGQRRSVHFAPI